MKILLINGSARQHGCTDRGLEEIAATLKAEGIDSEIIWIGNHVRGCAACGQCRKLGHCVFADDIVTEVAQKLDTADGIIVGTPVYYASPNGTVLAFLDRLFYSASSKLVRKPAACIAAARRAGTTASLDVILKYFTINQMPVVSSTYWNMIHGMNREDVDHDLEGLQTMRNLAKNMAWLVKAIDMAKKAGLADPDIDKSQKTNFVR